MCRDTIKLFDNINVTFILTIPYSNSDIYVSGKKTKQTKKKAKRESEIINPFLGQHSCNNCVHFREKGIPLYIYLLLKRRLKLRELSLWEIDY